MVVAKIIAAMPTGRSVFPALILRNLGFDLLPTLRCVFYPVTDRWEIALAISGNQIRAARSLVGMDQQTLADNAGIGINTVRNMEGVGADRIRVRTDTLDAVVDALRTAGVVLVDEGQSDGGPGVRLARAATRSFDTIEKEVVQYSEYLENDAPPGAGG
jgi:transcriptional regulator with XRE-family HTH domain